MPDPEQEQEIYKVTAWFKLPEKEADAFMRHLENLAKSFGIYSTDYSVDKDFIGTWPVKK